MKRSLLIFLLALSGCGGLGGQGLNAKAEDNATLTINFYVTDGGTDLGGLFYRPSGGTLVRAENTQPAEQPTTQPASKFYDVPITNE
jgi:hypothetical protein